MGWPLVIGFVLVCAIIGVSAWVKIKYRLNETISVQRKSRLLSVAERNFLGCLADALSEDYFIFAKLQLQDVIEAAPSAQRFNLKRIQKELDGYCFDFVLYKQLDMSIFAVIELEHTDRAVNLKKPAKPKQRDKVISRACKSAKLKLFYFDVRQDYKDLDLARIITGKSTLRGCNQGGWSATHQSQLSVNHSSYSVTGQIRNCPKCRSEVVIKVAVKGCNIGEKFLMCRKYPYCDYQVAIKDIDSISKMEQEEGRKSNTQGFKNWSSG
jgi:ssDNA-binding Zn-finger/Zn-ribbon topoisomerase 1